MIETIEKFHQLANGGLRPLNWNVGVSWQNSTTTSPQLLVDDGYGSDASSSFWSSMLADSVENLGNGWGRFIKSNAGAYTDLYASESAVAYKTNTQYTILCECESLENVERVSLSQANQTRNPFTTDFYVRTNETSARIVAKLTTSNTLAADYFGLRLFLGARTPGQEVSANIRVTIVEGWVDESEIYWQPYGVMVQDYEDLSNRAIGLSVSRAFEFPYNVQSAVADFSLDNHDGYLSFTGLNPSPIADYILPNRPVQIRYGFDGVGTVPNFTGYTEKIPTYDGQHDAIARFTAMDKLAQISAEHLPNMVMLKDARTDQVIEAIFEELGLDPSEYNLGVGANTIPFVYFDADKSVGNALKELVQAENGRLWQDEEGIIQFTPRIKNIFSQDPVMIFNKSNTLSLTPSRTDGIVNTVNISAEIRKVEDLQQVFLSTNETGYQQPATDDQYRVPANGTATVWLSFDDPVWSAIAPTLDAGGSTSSFEAVNLAGTKISSGITATGTLFATTYKLDFINTNASPVSISSISIWGEPAKLVGGQATEYFAYDDTSVAKFGTLSLDISDNRCFGSVANLRAYGNSILNTYSDYSPKITMKVKGDPALQLGDIVEVSIEQFEGRYQITKITNTIDNVSESKLETELEMRFIVSSSVGAFILDQSVLDGPDLLG